MSKQIKKANMTISANAEKQIKKLLKDSKSKNSRLRISVSSGGCSGFQYHFDFDNKKKKDDLEIFTKKEALAIIDETSLHFLEGSELDYVNELGGSYFKINNPNASSSCGCGSSFAV